MVTGGGHKCYCHAQLSSHWLPLFLCSPPFTDNVMQEHWSVFLNGQIWNYTLSAPYRSQPIKRQYQHQQDTAGHRETIAWL